MQNDAELDKERERGRTHFPALKEQISVSDHRWFVQFLHKGAGAKCFLRISTDVENTEKIEAFVRVLQNT